MKRLRYISPQGEQQLPNEWRYHPENDDFGLVSGIDVACDYPVVVTVEYQAVWLVENVPWMHLASGNGTFHFSDDGLLVGQGECLKIIIKPQDRRISSSGITAKASFLVYEMTAARKQV